MNARFEDQLANDEIIAKLREAHGPVIDALLCHEVYSVKGRLKLTTAARAIGMPLGRLKKILAECRTMLDEVFVE